MTTHISRHHLESKMTPQKLPPDLYKDDNSYVKSSSVIKDDTPKTGVSYRWQLIFFCHHLWLKMTLYKLQCDLWKDYNAKTMYLSAKRWAIKIFKMCCDLLTITTYFPRCHLSQICSRYLCCHLSQKMTLQFLRLNPYKDDTVKNAFLTVDHII